MITTCIPDMAKLDLLTGGVHEPGDSYVCALYDASAVLDATNAYYLGSGETAGTGYDSGGKAVTGFTIFDDTVNGAYFIKFDSVEWDTAAFNSDGFIIYNTSKSNKILVIVGFGQTWYVAGGTFLLPINAPGVIAWYKG